MSQALAPASSGSACRAHIPSGQSASRCALHAVAPWCTPHRTAPHSTAPHRTAPHRTAPPDAPALSTLPGPPGPAWLCVFRAPRWAPAAPRLPEWPPSPATSCSGVVFPLAEPMPLAMPAPAGWLATSSWLGDIPSGFNPREQRCARREPSRAARSAENEQAQRGGTRAGVAAPRPPRCWPLGVGWPRRWPKGCCCRRCCWRRCRPPGGQQPSWPAPPLRPSALLTSPAAQPLPPAATASSAPCCEAAACCAAASSPCCETATCCAVSTPCCLAATPAAAFLCCNACSAAPINPACCWAVAPFPPAMAGWPWRDGHQCAPCL